MPGKTSNGATRIGLPRTVWLLGLVSLFMDMSSEMAHAILPLFLVGPLGASVAMVGLIDGAAEAVAQGFKLFSGILSDWVQSRKWLAVLGYGLSALTKPLFPLSVSPAGVLAARLADRVGKGIRGSPRDAMVADVTPEHLRGAAFGLRQSLDTVGAIIGPLVAVGLLWWAIVDLRGILWVACVPALAAVMVLAFGVHEPERSEKPQAWRNVLVPANPGRAFWLVLTFGVVLSLARMTEAFLVLKAQEENLPTAFIPLVMVLMSFFYFLAAYPAGRLSDRIGAGWPLFAGCAMLALGDLLLAQHMGLPVMLAGIAAWGLHMGLTQGILGKLVADAAPMHLRASCFGLFYLACGVASLVSGLVAGLLWDRSGPGAAFMMGAGFAVAALVIGGFTNTARKQSPS